MTALLTTKFRHLLAKDVKDSVSNTTYYATAGKPLAFASDTQPPTPTDAVQSSHYDVYRDMVFGKKITADDVRIMVSRHDWTQGVVYDAYDHEDQLLYSYDKKFYVVVDEGAFFSVFKCLDNNNGSPSIHKPSLYETAADDEFYYSAVDGYQWKYMYTITKAEFEKFATTTYIPVTANTDVAANAVSGAIDTIRVVSGGSRYNSYHSGKIQVARVNGNNQLYTIESSASSNTDFYKNNVIKITSGPGAGQQRMISEYITSGGVKRILVAQEFASSDLPTADSTYEISPAVVVVGDGDGFIGRALVNATSNSVHAIEITDRGEGYTWANAIVVANTGIINSASNTYIQANNASLRVIIGPPRGHGSDVETELAGTHLGLSLTFNTTEAGGKLVTENDFRRIAIVKSPLFANVSINIASNTGTFAVGETVTQSNTGAAGVVTSANSSSINMTNVSGLFVTGNSTYGIITGATTNAQAQVSGLSSQNPGLYIDQTTTLYGNVVSSAMFVEDGEVYQGDHANGYVYFANSTVIKLSNAKGVFNVAETDTSSGMVYGNTNNGTAAANVSYVKLPDLVNASGEVLYIENITPISRANGQTETVKIIVEF